MYVSRGLGGIGCDDASALPPGINAASTGAFAFTEGDELLEDAEHTWVATTLSIVDLAVQRVTQLNRRASRRREASD